MLGMNTRLPNTSTNTIYHTPVAEMFAPHLTTRVWFAGSNVTTHQTIDRPPAEIQILIDGLLAQATSLFPRFDRANLLLTTRTLPAYPVQTWAATTTAGRGAATSIPTTHSALLCVVPADAANRAEMLAYFATTQPFNHIHHAPANSDGTPGPTMLVLHLTSVPGRAQDEWALSDLLRDLRRGWKKHMMRIGENGSQRAWVKFADGREMRSVNSYNDLEARPFDDQSVDL